MKKTKIIATVGPVTESEERLKELYDNWVNIIRFNFSHAQHEHSKVIADRVKKLNAEGKTNLSLLLDTKGPEIRTWNLDEKLHFQAWDKVKIFIDDSKREAWAIFCDYEYLIEDINIWDIIIVDSGLCNVKVLEKHTDYVLAEMLNAWVIWSKRHINLPWVRLKLPWITDKDKEDVLFAVQNNYDFIAMSFVRNNSNIQELRTFLKENNAEHIKIISKIENQEAIENLEEIIKNSDWVMVARWDLWVEVAIEKLPYYQKQIVELCTKEGKMFVIATHLLETMIESPFPTRAEVSDIYNSVLQKADCIMLSWETTTWKYPIEAVQMMTKVATEAEKAVNYTDIDFENGNTWKKAFPKKIAVKNAINIANQIDAKAIIAFTEYGFTPKMAAACKPAKFVYTFTNNPETYRFLNSLYAVTWFMLDITNDYQKNLDEAIEILKSKNLVSSWDKVVVILDKQTKTWVNPTIEIVNI